MKTAVKMFLITMVFMCFPFFTVSKTVAAITEVINMNNENLIDADSLCIASDENESAQLHYTYRIERTKVSVDDSEGNKVVTVIDYSIQLETIEPKYMSDVSLQGESIEFNPVETDEVEEETLEEETLEEETYEIKFLETEMIEESQEQENK